METTILIYNSNTNPLDMAIQANKVRLSNKNKWYQLQFQNENTGEKTGLKCFNTWVQISTKPIFNTCMDKTPTEFKNNIENGLNNLIKNY